ncbi:SpoIIE family protein phosphatase [Desulfobacula sp.]|uniref:SpoIIE family protein phosphatase n=1 Tax=Desulfobacula sp. TaxID=2593537 RepID=UPI0026318866|nr:SpoIIE family protein phosphatase [Desulfobacula sp.]
MSVELNKCKVLLVDDIKENINVLVQALKDDYKLGFAMDGESALTYARTKSPDLILLDIMMPGMDGFEVSRKLKSDPRTQDIPFIFITAIDETENKAAGFELGAVDYITKPFEIIEVKARVKTHLSLLVASRQLSQQNRKMRQSLNLAKDVQQNLIPKADPIISGFDIAGRTIYCDETGGDYYDFIKMSQRGPDHFGIAVGDVSGHGIPSALLMASARAFLRQRASLEGEPSQIISDVNKQFCSDVRDSGQFMTLFFCCLNAREKQITWVRAGHEPAIFYDHKKGAVFLLHQFGGLPLGITKDATYQDSTLVIESGSIMVLISDGITETRNSKSEFFGKERVEQLILKHIHHSSTNILDAVIESVDQFKGSRSNHDDITIVVIKAL